MPFVRLQWLLNNTTFRWKAKKTGQAEYNYKFFPGNKNGNLCLKWPLDPQRDDLTSASQMMGHSEAL